jgi:hypothetical protein
MQLLNELEKKESELKVAQRQILDLQNANEGRPDPSDVDKLVCCLIP